MVGGLRTLIVQWDNRPHYSNIGSATFQLQLFESGPVAARFVYDDVDFGNASYNFGASATVGYQASTSDATQFSFNQPVLANGDVLDLLLSDRDLYQLTLVQGDVVMIQTGTPFDAVGYDPLNSLDPQLEVVAPGGAVVASDLNSGSDGKNAIVTFVAPADGLYFVNVSTESGSGEYTLSRSINAATGDFDGDGDLDCDDIDGLSRAIASGSSNLLYDVTSDGLVDVDDLNEWILNLKGTLFGDANLDFVVDGTDFGIWNQFKFTGNTAWCSGDFNADGRTDGSDFNVWNQFKFQSPISNARPDRMGRTVVESPDAFIAATVAPERQLAVPTRRDEWFAARSVFPATMTRQTNAAGDRADRAAVVNEVLAELDPFAAWMY